jgi:hypothetical protein
VTGAHAAATVGLPAIHGDPFDRMLIAQATAEGLTLVTSDQTVAKISGVDSTGLTIKLSSGSALRAGERRGGTIPSAYSLRA